MTLCVFVLSAAPKSSPIPIKPLDLATNLHEIERRLFRRSGAGYRHAKRPLAAADSTNLPMPVADESAGLRLCNQKWCTAPCKLLSKQILSSLFNDIGATGPVFMHLSGGGSGRGSGRCFCGTGS